MVIGIGPMKISKPRIEECYGVVRKCNEEDDVGGSKTKHWVKR